MTITCPACRTKFDDLCHIDPITKGKYLVCPECDAVIPLAVYQIRPTLAVDISQDDIDDIVLSAAAGIQYWCNKIEVVGGELLGEFDYQQISRGGTLKFYSLTGDCSWELNIGKLLLGIKLYLEYGGTGVLEADGNRIDICEVDDTVGDVILQYALFGEIRFH